MFGVGTEKIVRNNMREWNFNLISLVVVARRLYAYVTSVA